MPEFPIRARFLQSEVVMLVLSVSAVSGAPPGWWAQGDPPVIDVAAAQNNRGPANIGQAKWMAFRALAAIRAQVPTLADQIEADLVGSGKPIGSWSAPATPEEVQKQYSPLLVGQLKAISAPFYTHLHAAAGTWLAAERDANDTETGDGIFPWTQTNTTDDQNKAIATTGQLKAVFSLRFTEDGDGDSVPDFKEWVLYGGPGGGTTPLDLDGDGILDSAEPAAGRNVAVKDHPAVQLSVVVSG